MLPSAAIFVRPILVLAFLGAAAAAHAQESRIGPFVLDVRGTFPMFPDAPELAASRGLTEAELPGMGLGIDAGLHLYLLRWKAVTFGIGGQVALMRSTSAPSGDQPAARAVVERFTSIAPQLSLNFGNGDGWSYLSGGIGPGVWSIVPDGQDARPADEERLRTLNYGGGARWFARPHLAFAFDVRFYAVDPGIPSAGFPGSPRTTFMVLGAGISLK